MQLSPLQSRLAASVIASCLLLVIYLFLFSPQFALAAEFDPVLTDLDAPELAYEIQDGNPSEELDFRSSTYEPEFALFDRSIIGRVPDNVATIANNQVAKSNLAPGVNMAYVFLASSVSSRETQDSDQPLELRRSLNGTQEAASDSHGDDDIAIDTELTRRATKTLWISANTCDQPWRLSSLTTMDPPQLTLYVSTSSDNTSPGPLKGTTGQDAIVFTEGAVMYNVSLDRDIYMSVAAPSVSTEYFDTTKEYNFELVASTDQYYYSYRNATGETDLIWVDSDATAALLQTSFLTNTSDQILTSMPYVAFAHNQNNNVLNGMRNSYCGLSGYAQVRNLADGSSGMITMGLKNGGYMNLTRQEFYVTGLNASSNYTGFLARPPGTTSNSKRQSGSSSAGGGVVFQPTTFQTKPDGTCTFIFNMTFCDQTQYAVPGNLTNFPNGTVLAEFYDNYTRTMYDNFDKVLQQVPCETNSVAKYSLARNCDDCKSAYKNWLCSVAIPRCEDFSQPDRWYLQMRNIASPFANGSFVNQSLIDKYGEMLAYNSSRNPIIDDTVQPGPYKELLPCEDLCYDLVRSCPASMKFSCPRPRNEFTFHNSYGRDFGSGSLSCNYPGSAHYPAGADTLTLPGLALVGAASILFMVLL
ncbi:stretch-activated Ca2+-permeable channel component-domain-containing protein [Annulohypoxylon maeteangense]|uniref:stretch-activated Ca2+-permeable channel component-domain-containing protein n=1 Tax=Annulohypoxylon maeteangense TaxID=1927788 RepID=UPI002007997C|nr:stretch-activated Ca2+-permeable channel component-domain-containing protein [Annulohypoxylon maeteangense]KAI0885272.1 stretch-activated Ca2+-permeable channel component-domain-containing protein [Annulohypoxylon maeteangense]